MTLTGTYNRNLDDKHRLAVPKRLRTQFGDSNLKQLFVAPSTEKSLALYSAEAFENLATSLSQRTTNRLEVRNYLRLFYSQAEAVELDSQGRIRIPERLVEFAGLKRDVVLLGVQDHAEVWDLEQWESFLRANRLEFDSIANEAYS